MTVARPLLTRASAMLLRGRGRRREYLIKLEKRNSSWHLADFQMRFAQRQENKGMTNPKGGTAEEQRSPKCWHFTLDQALPYCVADEVKKSRKGQSFVLLFGHEMIFKYSQLYGYSLNNVEPRPEDKCRIQLFFFPFLEMEQTLFKVMRH